MVPNWAAASVVASASVGVARAQGNQQDKLSNDVLLIGVLTDISACTPQSTLLAPPREGRRKLVMGLYVWLSNVSQ